MKMVWTILAITAVFVGGFASAMLYTAKERAANVTLDGGEIYTFHYKNDSIPTTLLPVKIELMFTGSGGLDIKDAFGLKKGDTIEIHFNTINGHQPQQLTFSVE